MSYTAKQEEKLKHKNKYSLWSFKTIDNPDKYFKEVNILIYINYII